MHGVSGGPAAAVVLLAALVAALLTKLRPEMRASGRQQVVEVSVF